MKFAPEHIDGALSNASSATVRSPPRSEQSLVTSHESLLSTVRSHWPEYVIEAWALAMFMISAGCFGVLLDSAASPVTRAIEDADVRRILGGLAMGLTAIALIYSPWGKRSGAHMNPAITLAFLRLKHIAPIDAFFYILAQCCGGALGVVVVLAVFGEAFAQAPVSYVATVPSQGAAVAFAAEFAISFVMMTMVLRATSSTRYMAYTGLFAGALVALFISVEAPYSGMSMNPARTFASALPAGSWSGFWIYALAPIAAMQLAVALHVRRRGAQSVRCAKLMHTDDQRCIHCGYEPVRIGIRESGFGIRQPRERTPESAAARSRGADAAPLGFAPTIPNPESRTPSPDPTASHGAST